MPPVRAPSAVGPALSGTALIMRAMGKAAICSSAAMVRKMTQPAMRRPRERAPGAASCFDKPLRRQPMRSSWRSR